MEDIIIKKYNTIRKIDSLVKDEEHQKLSMKIEFMKNQFLKN